jgi:hypothetical protein
MTAAAMSRTRARAKPWRLTPRRAWTRASASTGARQTDVVSSSPVS